MSDLKLNFIVIDDSKLDCFIAEKIIQNAGKSNTIRTFQQATEALQYLETLTPDSTLVIFVDIQMPMMNGFEFVEAFEQLPEALRKYCSIYMLSSSINENDIAKVKGYSSIKQFVNKPLTASSIAILLQDY